jgi:hypothetical protein
MKQETKRYKDNEIESRMMEQAAKRTKSGN